MRIKAYINKLSHAFTTWTWKHYFTRKWCSIYYAHKADGFPYRELVSMWNSSVLEAQVNGYKSTGGFLGKLLERDYPETSTFFRKVAHLMHERADTYRCVYGCCSVIWFNGHNKGGGGPAGCPCDDMKDPRDLEYGPLPK